MKRLPLGQDAIDAEAARRSLHLTSRELVTAVAQRKGRKRHVAGDERRQRKGHRDFDQSLAEGFHAGLGRADQLHAGGQRRPHQGDLQPLVRFERDRVRDVVANRNAVGAIDTHVEHDRLRRLLRRGREGKERPGDECQQHG